MYLLDDLGHARDSLGQTTPNGSQMTALIILFIMLSLAYIHHTISFSPILHFSLLLNTLIIIKQTYGRMPLQRQPQITRKRLAQQSLIENHLPTRRFLGQRAELAAETATTYSIAGDQNFRLKIQ